MSSSPARTAAWLTCLCAGLGHYQCGRRLRGLVWLAASLAFLPLALWASQWQPSEWVPTVVTTACVLSGLAMLGAVFDAWLLARRLPRLSLPSRPALVVALTLGLALPTLGGEFLGARVFRSFVVPTHSMAPTIHPGDHVLAEMTSAGSRVQRGDVVVFPWPERPDQWLVKRVVALPGDRVSVVDGALWLDGRPAPRVGWGDDPVSGLPRAVELAGETPYPVLARTDREGTDQPELVVPAGMAYVLGDDRHNAVDSRVFGPVPLDSLSGWVEYVLWPPSRFGPLPSEKDVPKDLVELLRAKRRAPAHPSRHPHWER